MTYWVIVISLLVFSTTAMLVTYHITQRRQSRSKAGIFVLIAMAGLPLTILSGFIVEAVADGLGENDLMARVALGLIPTVLFLISAAAIWVAAQSDLDEMQEKIRNHGLTIGLFIAFMFFYCYGIFQLVGVPLPDFSGMGVVWVLFPCMSVPQLFLNWKFR